MQLSKLSLLVLGGASLVAPTQRAQAACVDACTTIAATATSTASVPFVLTAAATLRIVAGTAPDVGPGGAIEISGGVGPIAGFAIAQDVADHNLGAGLVFARIPEESAARARSFTWSGFGTTMSPQPSQVTFPAGAYRLYLLSDGPISITLRLEGATDAIDLEATEPVDFVGEFVPARMPGPGAGAYSMGSSHVVDRPAVVFGVFPMVASMHAATAFGYCATQFEPEDPTGDDVAFLPGCPTSVHSGRLTATVITSPGPYYQRADILSAVVPPSRYGIGYWYAGTVVADTSARGVQGWLELN